jgi:PAS domain-containing protein
MRRALSALTAATLASALAGAALAGCAAPTADPAMEFAAALSPEGTALAALGYAAEEVATGDPVATANPEPSPGPRWHRWRQRHTARVLLRRNVLHGEAVVQTAEGTRTVLLQRGEVTEVTDTAVTVTSADGFAQTWSFGEPLRVLESRTSITPDELEPGARIGVAGARTDGTPTARLIVIGEP